MGALSAAARYAEFRERRYARRGWQHAYRHFEHALFACLTPRATVLDLGCGATFPLARKLRQGAGAVYGVDPAATCGSLVAGAESLRGDATALPFTDATFDVIACRSVLEHLPRPAPVFGEVARVLKPGGVFVFLTPSRYDYVSVMARLTPQTWHAAVLRHVEGRPAADVHATHYRANTRRAVCRFAAAAGLAVERLDYLNHPPDYFRFSPLLYHLVAFYDSVLSAHSGLAFLRGWLLGILRKARREFVHG